MRKQTTYVHTSIGTKARTMPFISLHLLALLLSLPLQTTAMEVPDCGNLSNAYGPFNYITQKNKLRVVEEHHFTRKVERLIKGESGRIDADIDYTLRAFPNHHRALLSISRWEQIQRRKNKGFLPNYFSAECYFKRAIAFAPKDAIVHLIYGIHQHKSNQLQAAEKSYKNAIAINQDAAEPYYNIGLLYLDMQQPDKALPNAQKAYELGHPLPGLRNKLIKSGHWKEEIKSQ